MKQGERVTVTLTGGAPWGFRLQGGGQFPLEVAKIRKRSNAFDAGLREGDLVLSINGYVISGKSHQSAMDVVDMAGDKLTFEVSRSSSGAGASQPKDPQRQPRIIPMVSGPPENARPGVVSSAQGKFSQTDGNTRTDINTQEFVVKAPGGRKITKTITEQRVTRYPGATSPVPGATSPQPGYTVVLPPHHHETENYLQVKGQQTHTRRESHDSLSAGQHKSRSPNRTPTRSPQMWQPTSLSPDTRSNIPQSHSQPSSLTTSRSPLMWQPSGTSPAARQDSPAQQPFSPAQQPFSPAQQPFSPAQQPFSPAQQPSPAPPQKRPHPKETGPGKENQDPIMASEQAKWEAREATHTKFSVPDKYATWGGRGSKKQYVPKKIDDPNYPMFGVPQINWHAPVSMEAEPEPEPRKVPPPVAPKPVMMNGAPSPIPYGYDQFDGPAGPAGVGHHYPGMIKPAAQPNVAPAPPPPPMPPAPMPHTTFLPKPKGFTPGQTSTPGKDELDHERPDHLPVFGPKVMFSQPEDDSGLPLSPDRSDHHSDISSLARTDTSHSGESRDTDEENSGKVFSDSAFYDDSGHKYPTIDEQMSMCKKIADSLTSAANNRARGARMFMKRKRKADKWVHDQHHELFGFRSEYSSSTGDVADLQDLDSELYYDEGGNRPLFTFRIPKVAGQTTEGQRMSLSKEEFERLRLAAPKLDHQTVSPNTCFNIAADLHKGGKNRGAKLFAKRQARVEKFVIDETNVKKPAPDTRLDHMIHSPQSNAKATPWAAAAQGNVQAAWDQRSAPRMAPQQHHYPRHDLSVEQKPTQEKDNYNRKIRGWQSGPAHQQQNSYREFESPLLGDEAPVEDNTLLLAIASPNGGSDQWNNQQRRSPSPQSLDFVDADPHAVEFGDYNRRIKAFPGASGPRPHPRQAPPPQQPTYNYNMNPSYNSLPRGFSYAHPAPQQGIGACDL